MLNEHSVLAEIGRIIGSSLDIDDVYDDFAATVRTLIPFDGIAIMLNEPLAETLTTRYVRGVPVPERSQGDTYPLKGTISGRVIRERRSVFLVAHDEDELAHEHPGTLPLFRAGYRAFLIVPINLGDVAIGTLSLPSFEAAAYGERHIGVAQRIADQIAGAIASSQRLEQHVRMEESLRERTDMLERAIAEVELTRDEVIRQERLSGLAEMAKAITHHLNNKLTPILGFSELLLSRADRLNDAETPGRYLQAIHEASQNAASFVKDLRDFHREREHGVAYHEQVKLDEIARLALTLAHPMQEGREEGQRGAIRVETDLTETSPVYGNGSEIQQALANLILNAVEAMPQGGTLSVGARQTEGRVALVVGDTGVGMTPDVRKRCLDPLYTTKGPGRSGIGLSIVHGVVRRHKAALEIESEPGVGTAVTIFFRV